jgi:ABC-type glycerol-3-phosphate transport system permease component
MESNISHSNSSISTVLIGVGPVAVGILAGFYYDLFISSERGWNFLLYILLVSLSYLPPSSLYTTFKTEKTLETDQDFWE